MPAIRKGMDIKQVGSYLNTYGYKIVRKEANEEGSVDLTAMALTNIDHLFAKRGERPDIKFKFVEERPKGTIGRGNFQIGDILEMNEEDVKFVKKVMRTFLQLDPGIDMTKAKGNNPKGPRQRVIQKVLGVLGEFEVFEKNGYWPLEEFMLCILKSTSQTAKGYGQQSRARKKEREAAGVQDTTNNHSRPSGSKIGRPRKHPPPPAVMPSPESLEARVDAEAMQNTTALQDVLPAEFDENECIDHDKDVGVDDGEEVGEVIPGDIGKAVSTDTYEGEGKDGHEHQHEDSKKDEDEDEDEDNKDNEEFEHPMDISMRVAMHSDAPGLSNQDEDEVLEGFGNMSLDPSQDYEAEGPGCSRNLILTPDTSIPAFSHSRTNPFTPSAQPRRKLVREQQGPFESQEHHGATARPATLSRPQFSPTSTASATPAPALGSVQTTDPTLSTTALSTSESIEGMTPEVLTQLAALPASVIVTLPSALQAAVAGWKAARSILGLGSLPAPTVVPPPSALPAPISTSPPTALPSPTSTPPTVSPAPTSAPPPEASQFRRPKPKAPAQATLAEAHTLSQSAAKTVPADLQFDDAHYNSDPPSASESNRPINSRSERVPVVSNPLVAKAGTATADTETGTPTATVQPQDTQAVVKTGGAKPNGADPQDTGPHEPKDNVATIAGSGNRGGKVGRGAFTGANRGRGRRKMETNTSEPRALRSATAKNNTTVISK